MNKRFNPKRVALCGLLLSMMLVLGWVEHMIPLNAAIPGIKLGLSNGVLIFAVYMLDIPTAYVLMALKVVLSCAFLGNPASMMIYGFAGGVLSLTGMVLISRVKGMHQVTVSMIGGVLHNVGQVGVAYLRANLRNIKQIRCDTAHKLSNHLIIIEGKGKLLHVIKNLCTHIVFNFCTHHMTIVSDKKLTVKIQSD